MAQGRWSARSNTLGVPRGRLTPTLATSRTMKRYSKMLVIVFASSIALVIAAIALLYLRNYCRTSYHNNCIAESRDCATEIQIKCKAFMKDNDQPKLVILRDKEQILFLLNRFKLPYPRTMLQTLHQCEGNLAITIISNGSKFTFSYDHGNGIYPISTHSDRDGFYHLDPLICSELNAFFKSLGFTDMEIGIYNK